MNNTTTMQTRTVLAAQALQNQRRDDQHVDVSYDDRPAGGEASGQAPRTPMRSRRPRSPGRATAVTNRVGTLRY